MSSADKYLFQAALEIQSFFMKNSFVFSIIGIVFGILSLKTHGYQIGIAGLVICIIATILRVTQTLLFWHSILTA